MTETLVSNVVGDLLAERDDVLELASRFAGRGRVVVPDVLRPELAEALHRSLLAWDRWALVAIVGGRHRNFDSAQMDRLPAGQRSELEWQIHAEARAGLQYLYERFPVHDPDRPPTPPSAGIAQLQQLLQSAEFLSLVRAVTGEPAIRGADGQITRYRAGHYLTVHDDHAEGVERVAAYVLGLTRDWAADYGGQLQFVDRYGRVDEAVVPGFNTLTMFRVPQPHLVSAVAPFVDVPRLSLTGWLRR